MAGLYAADGSLNVTGVDGSTYVGLYAADGSYNVVETDGTTFTGLFHPSGAYNVVISDGRSGYYHPSGALNISIAPAYVENSVKVTVVAGSVGGPDVTAPVITSSNTATNLENTTLAKILAANEPVTWSITGGADALEFDLAGNVLTWASDGTKNFESPDDADADNAYVVEVTATDLATNATPQTITVTVTDVFEEVGDSITYYIYGF